MSWFDEIPLVLLRKIETEFVNSPLWCPECEGYDGLKPPMDFCYISEDDYGHFRVVCPGFHIVEFKKKLLELPVDKKVEDIKQTKLAVFE
jgi:hypothetical protein|tara:strand:+ start:180 stop:449 length:270 start_codon:yes stop_codon:yes gene_type:complete